MYCVYVCMYVCTYICMYVCIYSACGEYMCTVYLRQSYIVAVGVK